VGAVGIVGGTLWYSLESPVPTSPPAVAVTTVPTTTLAAAPPHAARPVAAATPSPQPLGAEPTPSPLATPESTPAPTPVAMAARPVPALTPAPVAVATPEPTPPPPAGISHLTPPTLARRPRVLVDVHGGWFRADHRALILRKGQPVGSPKVARQKLASSEVIQLLLTMDDKTETGEYSLVLVGQDGVRSNAIVFQVTK